MRKMIGVVDYGSGNHASLVQTLRRVGFLPIVSTDAARLGEADALVLPGVGAFPAAMQSLKKNSLDNFMCEWVLSERPLLGVCLGMQLMGDTSDEQGHTKGLGLIPGKTVGLRGHDWNIGWDTLTRVSEDAATPDLSGSFYFNHCFEFVGNDEYSVAVGTADPQVQAMIRHGSAVGVQFHPEKSQLDGQRLLLEIVSEMTDGR